VKIPKKIRTYCPYCRKHQIHDVKKIKFQKSPAKARAMALGQRRHLKRTRGYVSKIGGKKSPIKQRHKSVLLLECTVCKKKQQRSFGDSKKSAEFKKD